MAVYNTGVPPYHQAQERKYEEEWSLVQITLKDQTDLSINIKAGPGIAAHLASQMHEKGSLFLFNNREALLVNREEFGFMHITKLTTGETP